MAAVIYALCALTSLTCAVLLLRSYARSGLRLLLWSGLCFVGLTGNNVMLVLDRIVLTAVDLTTTRLAIAFVAYLLLLIGLIWEND
ncbi:MAG TPA: DUF5985 family protein [Usitatibacter sp.]|jgi:hypothetical protein|nr:DUF5985 family protein [Usitatibacter sp.]